MFLTSGRRRRKSERLPPLQVGRRTTNLTESPEERDQPTIWDLALEGRIAWDDVREAYVETLEIAFEDVKYMIPDLEGHIVITADHGELLGERVIPGGPREWGHIPRNSRQPPSAKFRGAQYRTDRDRKSWRSLPSAETTLTNRRSTTGWPRSDTPRKTQSPRQTPTLTETLAVERRRERGLQVHNWTSK